MAEGTLFFDLENPLNCLGRNGWMLVCLMILELFIGVSCFIQCKVYIPFILVGSIFLK